MKPMSKKIRLLSLIFLFLIFIVVAPILAAYSLGYNISDINNVFTFEKTGGIYIHTNISNTEFYLDNKFVKSNGILLKNILMQNLKPNKNHFVEVQKNGYQGWIKNLFVYPGLVTEARVLMLPKDIIQREILPFLDSSGNATTTVSKNVKFIKDSPIPNNNEYKNLMILFAGKDIYATSTETKIIANLNIKKVTATSTSTIVIPESFKKLGIKNSSDFKNFIEKGDEISWLDNDNIILNWTGNDVEVPYYYCLAPENCRKKIILDWKDKIKKFDFLPRRNDVFLVLVDSGLYAVEVDDRSERNIQYIYNGKIDDFIVGPNEKIFIKKADKIFELDI